MYKIEEELLFFPRSSTSRDSNALKYFELTENGPWKPPNSVNGNPLASARPTVNLYVRSNIHVHKHETYLKIISLGDAKESKVSKNPEIFSNLMPQNQINGVDKTASDIIGFDRHNALIWSFKAKISAFQGEFQSYSLFYWILIFID